MAIVYSKTADGKLMVTDSKIVEEKHDLRQLRKHKQMLKAKLDEINILIDEAVKLGATDEP
jgi:ABC-type phosphate transport system ATPase subunit